ncbi:MAG TPA: DinB family protein [Terriglobales bacterium]|nr:DinB family protein [Terriglobales bacterium]
MAPIAPEEVKPMQPEIISESVEVLKRTPKALTAMLSGLPDVWLHCNEGESTWSAYDVIGHLIHGELTDWIPRLQIILKSGESRPFTPFDRSAQFKASQGKSMKQLLREFAKLRRKNLAVLTRLKLTSADLKLRGMHPELGPVTLGQLISTWVVHDMTHINQISRVLAKRFNEEVGPWQAYLSVLTRR